MPLLANMWTADEFGMSLLAAAVFGLLGIALLALGFKVFEWITPKLHVEEELAKGNTAVGMFTERDVVRAVAEHGANAVNVKVSQLVSVQQLVSCTSSDTIEHVRHLMNRNHIRHLPVIDDYSLVSVISMRDIAAAVDEALNGSPQAAA